MIAVVIPYFQRAPGVLRKALASVAAQHGCPLPVRVIVVDDASPAPPAPEIDAAALPAGMLRLIARANGGPGAARNTGLDQVPDAARYVAFLDSDDEWSSDHLARAAVALDAGHDFYFANHLQLGQQVGAFARAGRIAPAEHPPLGAAPGLHAYRGDMLDQIIRGNVVGTSTVVYRRAGFERLRFLPEFANAGEDYLFWMSLAHAGARIAFSSRVEATYGKGVNVYAGAGWGTEQHLLRVHNELKFKRRIGRAFPVTVAQRAHIDAGIRDLRVAFARDLLHRLAHGRRLPLGLLTTHLLMDPLSYLQLPAVAVGLAKQRS